MISKLILALAAATATAVEDAPDPSPKLRGAMAAAIESKLQTRVGGRRPRIGGYVPPDPTGGLRCLHSNSVTPGGGIYMTWSSDGSITSDSTSPFWVPDRIVAVYQLLKSSMSDYVYVGDGDTDTVYKIRDTDGDNVADEEIVWFSNDNAEGFTLPTPNGLWEVDDALYIVNAGTGSMPQDAVYKTMDLDNNGDADGAGESSMWLDLSAFDSTSSAFTIEFVGDAAYIYDSFGGSPRVWRAEDTNGDGTVDTSSEDEFGLYADNIITQGGFAFPFGIAMDGPDVLFCDGNCYRGKYAGGVITVWEVIWDSTEAKMPDGSPVAGGIGGGFDIKLHDGEIWMTNQDLNGFPNSIMRLTDVDSDGKYNSVGETHIWTDEFVDKARAMDVYGSD